MNDQPKHFTLVSLGCPKNRVDSERILFCMNEAGFAFSHDPAACDVIIINTCAFIEAAVEESIAAILDHRVAHPGAFLVAAGCLPSRYGQDLVKSMPEIDLFLTPDQIHNLPAILAAASITGSEPLSSTVPGAHSTAGSEAGRVLTTPGYAYLKIAEGCSRSCRYCTIPAIRGPLKSERVDTLVQEAQSLARRGVKELVLTAQDLASYGRDLKEKSGLVKLLQRLEAVPGIEWIRLMYLHPQGIPPGLERVVADSEKILPYLDIPFQHVSDKVLRSMGRPWKGDRTRQLVDGLREAIEGLVLRTTFMVGFPGEGEAEFQELCEFAQSYQLEHVGVFEYSPEEGTAAFRLGDPVPGKVKRARAKEIRRLNGKYATRRNRKRIGSMERAIVEGVSQESEFLLQGRTWDQAPEVDGVLYIVEGQADAGEIHRVRITGAHGPDLFGAIESG